MALPSFSDILRRYELEPHPEGGFYRRTYCSAGQIPAQALPPEFGTARPYGTAILYLLGPGDKSRLHRIRQDEIWHFYLGGPLRLVILDPKGKFSDVLMGSDIMAGQAVQFTVPKGCWFGAKPSADSPYAFVGCTVAPGFDFADFEMGERAQLLRDYPALQHIVTAFTDEPA